MVDVKGNRCEGIAVWKQFIKFSRPRGRDSFPVFNFQVNTYIIVPTADKYATSLGAAPTLCGLIIGSMAMAQLLSSVYLSAWSNKSYFGPIIFSSVILSLGNLLYALAYNFNSVTVLLIGRLLCGSDIYVQHPNYYSSNLSF